MNDQAERLRRRVSKNKLEKFIDNAQHLKDIGEIYDELPERRAETILFISAKGGTGKTTVIENFAYILRSQRCLTAIIALNQVNIDISSVLYEADTIRVGLDDLNRNRELQLSPQSGRIPIFSFSDDRVSGRNMQILCNRIRLLGYEYILLDTPLLAVHELAELTKSATRNVLVVSAEMLAMLNSAAMVRQLAAEVNRELRIMVFINRNRKGKREAVREFAGQLKTAVGAENVSSITVLSEDIQLCNISAACSEREELVRQTAFYNELSCAVDKQFGWTAAQAGKQ